MPLPWEPPSSSLSTQAHASSLPVSTLAPVAGPFFPPSAGTLPLRISPSKTPVRIDSRRSGEGQRSAPPQLALSPGAVTALAQANPHLSAAHLNPALLMAVAGFNMGAYPPHYAG